jgi:uncharacterized protein (DUF1919 family)
MGISRTSQGETLNRFKKATREMKRRNTYIKMQKKKNVSCLLLSTNSTKRYSI